MLDEERYCPRALSNIWSFGIFLDCNQEGVLEIQAGAAEYQYLADPLVFPSSLINGRECGSTQPHEVKEFLTTLCKNFIVGKIEWVNEKISFLGAEKLKIESRLIKKQEELDVSRYQFTVLTDLIQLWMSFW